MEERHKRLLIKQNPWWRDEQVELPQFERSLIQDLLKFIDYKQILSIVGLRRVGKTILIKQIIQKLKVSRENLCYIAFDDIDFQDYRIAEDLINYFLEFSKKDERRYMFLDEVQKLPHWADLLKTYYDLEENLKIFVSGSASLEIKEYKETLAGRILTFHLPILTFQEFVRYFGMEYCISEDIFREYDLKFITKKERYKQLFESYLIKGAFPELLEINEMEFIKKYIKKSVIEKAIFDIARITKENEKIIYELFRLLVKSNSQLFEIVNLANTLSTNRNLVSRYINFLEKTFLIRVSYNFTASVAKQVRASKKQYCAHSSIAMALLDYPPEILKTELVGHLVEATVANSIEGISFWRTPYHEVDIVLKRETQIIPIEVKYKTQIDKSDIKSLVKFMTEFKLKTGFVISRDLLSQEEIDNYQIFYIPVWLFLLIDHSYFFKNVNQNI